MFEITMLPARQGDALWIRWGDETTPHQIIVDMGTEETGKRIRKDKGKSRSVQLVIHSVSAPPLPDPIRIQVCAGTIDLQAAKQMSFMR
jgi:hypothetical protein